MSDVKKETAERISTERLEELIEDNAGISGQAEAVASEVVALARYALASRHADAQEGGEVELLWNAILSCPHTITGEEVVLGYSSDKPGKNAAAQLHDRISAALNPRKETVEVTDTKNTVSDERLADIEQWAASEEAECLADEMPVSASYYQDIQAMDVGVKGLTDYLWQEFCELPDRSSPEDYPDMALVNQSELTAIVETFFERRALDLSPAEGGIVACAQKAYDILVSGNPPFSARECRASYALTYIPGLNIAAPSNPAISDELVRQVRQLEEACNAARTALADMTNVQDAIYKLDCRPLGVSAALSVKPQSGSDKP